MHKGRSQWPRPLWSSLMSLFVGVRDARLLFQGRLRCCQPCRQQTEGRAGDVVEADLMAELDGLWIAAMFAADADLQVRPRVASLGDGALHQLPHAGLIEGGEGVLLEDAG